MKITKKATVAFLRQMLATNERWATRALVAIYNQQTAAEQESERTIEHNGVGFSGPTPSSCRAPRPSSCLGVH